MNRPLLRTAAAAARAEIKEDPKRLPAGDRDLELALKEQLEPLLEREAGGHGGVEGGAERAGEVVDERREDLRPCW